MKVLIATLLFAFSVQAHSQTTQGWLNDRFIANDQARALVELFASSQSYDLDPVTCDYKNLKVVSVKGALNSTKFEAEIVCTSQVAPTSPDGISTVQFKGYVEDSQIFPTRLQLKSKK